MIFITIIVLTTTGEDKYKYNFILTVVKQTSNWNWRNNKWMLQGNDSIITNMNIINIIS